MTAVKRMLTTKRTKDTTQRRYRIFGPASWIPSCPLW